MYGPTVVMSTRDHSPRLLKLPRMNTQSPILPSENSTQLNPTRPQVAIFNPAIPLFSVPLFDCGPISFAILSSHLDLDI